MSYDLLLAAAVVLGFQLALAEAERRGLDRDRVFWSGVITVVAGFVGSRVWVVLGNLDLYAADPLDPLRVWRGGTGSVGAWVGGLVGALAGARWQRVPTGRLLDCSACSAAAGVFIGRVACFFNGCCYGAVTSVPWAIERPAASVPQVARAGYPVIAPEQIALHVHPVQLYEAAYGLALLALLWRYRRAPRPPGAVIALFFILYGLGRFVTEFFRGDSRGQLGPLSLPQTAAAGAFVLGLTFVLRAARRAERVA